MMKQATKSFLLPLFLIVGALPSMQTYSQTGKLAGQKTVDIERSFNLRLHQAYGPPTDTQNIGEALDISKPIPFKTGARIVLRLAPQFDAYCYIINVTTKTKSTARLIWPLNENENKAAPANQDFRFPMNVSGDPAREDLLLLVSPKKLDGGQLDRLLKQATTVVEPKIHASTGSSAGGDKPKYQSPPKPAKAKNDCGMDCFFKKLALSVGNQSFSGLGAAIENLVGGLKRDLKDINIERLSDNALQVAPIKTGEYVRVGADGAMLITLSIIHQAAN